MQEVRGLAVCILGTCSGCLWCSGWARVCGGILMQFGVCLRWPHSAAHRWLPLWLWASDRVGIRGVCDRPAAEATDVATTSEAG